MIEANIDNYRELIAEMKQNNARLVQICCTKAEGFELTYSFDIKNSWSHIRLNIEEDQNIESICDLFGPAFMYENEMKDLFGVKINHVTPDFNGEFYKLAEPAPFDGSNKLAEPAPFDGVS